MVASMGQYAKPAGGGSREVVFSMTSINRIKQQRITEHKQNAQPPAKPGVPISTLLSYTIQYTQFGMSG